ncbi:MAG: hypothetical protein QOF78_476, partial [Phycisphaerales bacterium]|nr:hypothetical protein [Phycisphaerales bacterium]
QHARSVERDPDVASPAAAAETLRELVRAQPEAHRRAADAKDAYDRAIALVSNGEELPAVRRAIERDPQLRSMRDAVREFERLAPPMPAPPEYGQRRARLLEAARRNRDDATASARARAEASVLEDLRRRHDEAARQRRDLDERAERAIAALEFRPLQAQLDLLTTLVRELDAAIDAAERGGPPAGTGANGNRRGNAQENANGDVPSN